MNVTLKSKARKINESVVGNHLDRGRETERRWGEGPRDGWTDGEMEGAVIISD